LEFGVARACDTLLKSLGVPDPSAAYDGPGQEITDLLFYASVKRGGAISVPGSAYDRRGIVEGLIAACELAHLAKSAIVGKVGAALIPTGHREDAINDWIAAQMRIYEELTGRPARISVKPSGDADGGEPTGPFLGFLVAAAEPLCIRLSPNAWRGRVRRIRTDAGSKKN
jgi:hypothetical protein